MTTLDAGPGGGAGAGPGDGPGDGPAEVWGGRWTQNSLVVGGPVSQPVSVSSIIIPKLTLKVGTRPGPKPVSETSGCSLGASAGGGIVEVADMVVVAFTAWPSPSNC